MSKRFMVSCLAAACGLALTMGQAALANSEHKSGEGVQPAAKVARASDLMSLAVYGAENKKIGKIEDMVIDPASGQIRYAVLSFGTTLGMGGKYFAVPWKDVEVFYTGATKAGTEKEGYCKIDVTEQALKNAPGFDKNQWPNFADENFANNLESFYGRHSAAAKTNGEQR